MERQQIVRAASNSPALSGVASYTPHPIITWKLSRKDATRIACHCKRPARYGRTADGGAPFIYECSKHIPIGVPVEFCKDSKEIVAAVERRNELLEKKYPRVRGATR